MLGDDSATSLLVVSTAGATPLTVTVSSIAWIPSTKSAHGAADGDHDIPTSAVANPESSAVRWYRPGAKARNR
jgi:hypothetical protein